MKEDDKSFIKGLITGAVTAIIAAVVTVICIFIKGKEQTIKVNKETAMKYNTVKKLIEEKFFYDSSEINFEDGLIRGYVESLGDPYSTYYTAEEYQSILESSKGVFVGMGVYISKNEEDNTVKIDSVIDGSSANEEGVKAGDIIYSVDGVKVTADNESETIKSLSGEPGSVVKLTVLRNNELIDFEITLKEIENKYVGYKMQEDNIAYIAIRHFTNATVNQFKEAVDSMKKDGARAVIFDVRDNTGGTMSSLIEMVDYILPEGMILYTMNSKGERKDYKSTNETAMLDIPCVVLTNENTASAAEVFSAAIKDRGFGVTIGTNTFGKGIVQSIFPLKDGSALKLTIEKYYTPGDVCIHGIGIAPDVEVEIKQEDINNRIDTQFEAAMEYLKKK